MGFRLDLAIWRKLLSVLCAMCFRQSVNYLCLYCLRLLFLQYPSSWLSLDFVLFNNLWHYHISVSCYSCSNMRVVLTLLHPRGLYHDHDSFFPQNLLENIHFLLVITLQEFLLWAVGFSEEDWVNMVEQEYLSFFPFSSNKGLFWLNCRDVVLCLDRMKQH